MSINRIALYHLETLFWIDRLGTFAAAAERLNTTQPAVSARMRELETRVGTALFRRDGRLMSLTPAARKLVRECEPLLRQMEAVLLGSGGFGEARGVVRMGAGEIAAATILPPFLVAVKQDMPLVGLEVEIDLTARLISQLLAGHTDLVFAVGPVAHPALTSHPIGAVDLLWLARPDVAQAFADYRSGTGAAVPFWSLASHSPIYQRMRAGLAELNMTDAMLNLSNNARMMVDIASAGGGVGVFPEPMVRAELASGALAILPDMPVLEPVHFLALTRSAESDPILQRVYAKAKQLDMSRRSVN